ncbi:MAG: 1,4-dihydroxy-6-naphthoate synthase [Bacteroidia bacterium]
MTSLTVGLSPCPNDTFMFDAMLHQKIDVQGFTFSSVMKDVQQLNQDAFNGDLDITKMSFFAYASASANYKILNSGSALGKSCGPILISKKKINANDDLSKLKVCIPGVNTTANLLLSIFYPQITNKTELVFSEIENALLRDEFDAGLIIHENRFTYRAKGLNKIVDLGEQWETRTGYPIPLGCIAVKRTLPQDVQIKIDAIMRESIKYAFSNREDVMDFVRNNAQEMDDDVMKQHIALYVNEFSVDLGSEGKSAIALLFAKGKEIGLIKNVSDDIFV